MIEIPDGIIRTREGVYVLRDDTHLSRWIEAAGRLDVAEEEINRCFAKYIPAGGVVVDAGASLGDHALTYSKLVGENGKVVCFEPNPLPYFCVAHNLSNRVNAFCIEAALSDRRQRVLVRINPNAGASWIDTLTEAANLAPDQPVMAAPLDIFTNEFERLDFIHLDVEGFELRALMGAQATLLRFRPTVAMEINKPCMERTGASEEKIRAYMLSLQYRFQEAEPGFGPHMEQRDIIAIPNERY